MYTIAFHFSLKYQMGNLP